MSNGGNTVPRVTLAEHIGLNDTGDNIEAKRVANYIWDGSAWIRSTPAASGGATEYTTGDTTSPAPVGGIPVFDDGGTIRAVSDTHPLPVNASVTATVDTTGLATDTAQATGNTSLASIDGKITAVDTGAVVISSSALPSGAATAANQQTDALTDTQLRAAAVPVSGTFWQTTQPISAASLPLPSGAATSAKQPALGTAGSAASDVLTVQGISSMTPLKVDGSATTQPVSGTFWQSTQPVSLASLPSLAAGTAAIGTVGTTSAAVNVNQQTVGTTAVRLTTTSTVPKNGIIIKAVSTNSAPIFVGGSGVTTSNGYELVAGESISFTCNLNTLYIISAASTTDKVCWNVE
jgi:hypothetical protein